MRLRVNYFVVYVTSWLFEDVHGNPICSLDKGPNAFETA